MKVLHFSDLHIGYERYSKTTDLETGLDDRIVDFLNVFDELINYAIEEDVDLVLFAGDAFKTRNPTPTHLREFSKRLLKLTNNNIPVVLVVGNHDIPAVKQRATSLDIFPTMNIDKVTVIDKLKLYTIDTKNSGPIQIIGLPWPRFGTFTSSIRKNDPNMKVEEITKTIVNMFDSSIKIELEKLNKDIPCIFSGHLSVMEAKTSTETLMSITNDPLLSTQFFIRPEFEYVGLGHIHKDQILNENPPVIYSGSLERVDFGEKDDEKGFYICGLDTNKKQGERLIDYKKIKVSARTFNEIKIHIPKNEIYPDKYIQEKLSSEYIKDSIIRIELEATREHFESINNAEIKKILSTAKNVVSIIPSFITEKETHEVKLSEDLGIIETFEKYLENFNDIDDKRKKDLLEFGKDIISEYELEND